MASILFVIAPKNFRDEELLEPLHAVEGSGRPVLVASTRSGACVGVGGTSVEAQLALAEVDPMQLDGIVFVGGPGARVLFDDPEAHRLARELFDAGKLVGAICIAPVILARAGLLRGRRATVFESETSALQEAGARVEPLGVVTDGTLITARGPREARDFGKALVKALEAHPPFPSRSSQPRSQPHRT